MNNVYSRINVEVAGQSLTARPISFVYSGDEIVGVDMYETTCPGCGCMIHFKKDSHVGCSECGAGGAPKNIRKDELFVAVSGQIVEKNEIPIKKAIVNRGCPFVDPIELGTFAIT